MCGSSSCVIERIIASGENEHKGARRACSIVQITDPGIGQEQSRVVSCEIKH